MTGNRQNRFNVFSRRIIEIGIPILVILILCIFIFYAVYLFRLKSLLRKETENYLQGISEVSAQNFDKHIADKMNTLTAIAAIFHFSDDIFNVHNKQILTNIMQSSDFDCMAIADISGQAYFTCDTTTTDISNSPYFSQIKEGNSFLAGPVYIETLKENAFVFGVPLLSGNGKTGAILGIRSIYTADNLFTAADQDITGNSFSIIIDENGLFIAGKYRNLISEVFPNFFDGLKTAKFKSSYTYDQIIQNMKQCNGGLSNYLLGNYHLYMAYQPLEYNNWYFLTFISEESLTQRSQSFFILSVILCSFFLLVMFIVCILLGYNSIQYQNKLQSLAFKDPLLDGGNGLWFMVEAQKLIQTLPPERYMLVYIDIESLRIINESFGRDAGDWTIQHVYRCICSILTSGEITARDNQDDFLLLMKYHSVKIARERLEMLSYKINCESNRPYPKFFIGLCAGLYIIKDPTMDFDSIKDKTFIALNNARRQTGSIVHYAFFKEEDRTHLLEEKNVENRMISALDNKEFIVYLQPKYSLKTDTISGAEALVRWIDPEIGTILPASFIPLFERSGFILELDLYVFENVCKIMRKWLDSGHTPCIISINLSTSYLSDKHFLERFESIRAQYQIPAFYLELEISGLALASKWQYLTDIVNQIHDFGYLCSLDDFGSVDSLNALRHLPIDVLKLNRDFFTGGKEDKEKTESIIESIVELARKLHIHIVAEGVENTDQVEFLRRIHCDMIQGYIYSGPVTIEAFEKMYSDGLFQK